MGDDTPDSESAVSEWGVESSSEREVSAAGVENVDGSDTDEGSSSDTTHRDSDDGRQNEPNTSTDSTEERDKAEDGSDSGDDLTYALIQEATQITDYEKLDDPLSLPAQVARSRGKVRSAQRLTDIGEGNDDGYQIVVDEGRLNVESGYVIRYVPKKFRGSLEDGEVAALDTIRAYPAPEELIESLTPRIRGYLKEQGYVKVRGHYSPEQSRFYGLRHGWESDGVEDPWDFLIDILDQVSSVPAAIDYAYAIHGPERWDAEELAEARGVRKVSIENNIRAVQNELNKPE